MPHLWLEQAFPQKIVLEKANGYRSSVSVAFAVLVGSAAVLV
jgi:hypothetical protein